MRSKEFWASAALQSSGADFCPKGLSWWSSWILVTSATALLVFSGNIFNCWIDVANGWTTNDVITLNYATSFVGVNESMTIVLQHFSTCYVHSSLLIGLYSISNSTVFMISYSYLNCEAVSFNNLFTLNHYVLGRWLSWTNTWTHVYGVTVGYS